MRHFLPRAVLVLVMVVAAPPMLGEPAPNAASLPAVDIPYMLRGYFLAGSEADRKAAGGYGVSLNAPRRIDHAVPRNALTLTAYPDEALPFGKKYRGLRVVLANTTAEQAAFTASDSRLSLYREAVDRDGQWKKVEYLPQSWCGNSYHRVFLPAGRQWSFAAPVYQGSFPTRMRFVLLLDDDKVLYSNEFPGSVNPQQFTVEQGHEPTNIMDPYNN